MDAGRHTASDLHAIKRSKVNIAAIPELDGDAIDVVVRHALTNAVRDPSYRPGMWWPFLSAVLTLRSISGAFSDSVRRSKVLEDAIQWRMWACVSTTVAMRLWLRLPHDLRAMGRNHPLIMSTLGGISPDTRRFAVFAFNSKHWDLLGWALVRGHAKIQSSVKHRLKRVKIPGDMPDCGDETFRNFERLEHVEIDGAFEIGRQTFGGCRSLKTLKLGEGLRYIHLMAFHGCPSLRKVHLPSTTRMVGAFSFCKCTQLTEVVLNDGLESILAGAFGDGNRIKRLVIPATVRKLGEGILEQRADIIMLGRPTKVDANAFHPDSAVTFLHSGEQRSMRWGDVRWRNGGRV
jgi:hypothetical protein